MPGFQSEGLEHHISERERRWQSYLVSIAAGQSDALTCLYEESAPALLGLAMRMLKNIADAEEVILDVYEQVWRTAHTFDAGRGTSWRWLTVMVRSRAVDRLRAASSRHNRGQMQPLADSWDPISLDPLPDCSTILNQERSLIRSALQMLPPDQRQPVELAYFSGLTHVEIASELGVPLGTIKTRIRAAMDKLRLYLSRGGLAATAGTLE